jgi:aminoglycoside phosphotransferase (APT) family kinase protein
VTVRAASGDHQELVLRRWARPGWELHDPDETPEREAAVLELLGAVPVPTPRLINLDSDGSVCDVPALLTDRLPGGPPGPPGDRDSFVRQLAEVLPAIHAVCDVPGEIPPYRRYHENLDSIEPPWWARRPDLWRQGAELVAEDPPPARRECFIHRDYHPGNTLWSGGRLTGVVDWTQGSWGPPGVDTAHMRWNLAVGHGLRGSAVGRCA